MNRLIAIAVLALVGCGESVETADSDTATDTGTDTTVTDTTPDTPADTTTDTVMDTAEEEVVEEYWYNCTCQWSGYNLDYEVCAPDSDTAQDLAKEACDEAHAEYDPCNCPFPCTLLDMHCP